MWIGQEVQTLLRRRLISASRPGSVGAHETAASMAQVNHRIAPEASRKCRLCEAIPRSPDARNTAGCASRSRRAGRPAASWSRRPCRPWPKAIQTGPSQAAWRKATSRPSCQMIFTSEPARPRNTNRSPPWGSRFSPCWTISARPCIPLRLCGAPHKRNYAASMIMRSRWRRRAVFGTFSDA